MSRTIYAALALLSLVACKKSMTEADRKEWSDWADQTCECKPGTCKPIKAPQYPKGGGDWSDADQAFVAKQEERAQRCALQMAKGEGTGK